MNNTFTRLVDNCIVRRDVNFFAMIFDSYEMKEERQTAAFDERGS